MDTIFGPLCEPERQPGRQRGGWRQRLLDAPNNEIGTLSSIACGHLRDWGDGIASAAGIRRHLNNAVHDGCLHPMITRLARIGGQAVSPSSAARDLLSILGDKCKFNDLISKIVGGDITHIVRPSLFLTMLYTRFPSRFELRIGANADKV